MFLKSFLFFPCFRSIFFIISNSCWLPFINQSCSFWMVFHLNNFFHSSVFLFLFSFPPFFLFTFLSLFFFPFFFPFPTIFSIPSLFINILSSPLQASFNPLFFSFSFFPLFSFPYSFPLFLRCIHILSLCCTLNLSVTPLFFLSSHSFSYFPPFLPLPFTSSLPLLSFWPILPFPFLILKLTPSLLSSFHHYPFLCLLFHPSLSSFFFLPSFSCPLLSFIIDAFGPSWPAGYNEGSWTPECYIVVLWCCWRCGSGVIMRSRSDWFKVCGVDDLRR